jgi:hypothetical protein
MSILHDPQIIIRLRRKNGRLFVLTGVRTAKFYEQILGVCE